MELKKITDHAAERYAERIADKEGRTDIKSYAIRNREKVEKDLRTMVERSECFYEGPGLDKKPVKVCACGSWILVISMDDCLITLYKKDLGVDDEALNVKVMEASIRKAKTLGAAVKAAEEEIAERRAGLDKEIRDCEAAMAEYRKLLKDYEKYKEDLSSERQSIMVKSQEARMELTGYMNDLLSQKLFGI